MRVSLLTVESKNPSWFEDISSEYKNKISHFVTFDIHRVRKKNLSRSDSVKKREQESDLILSTLEKTDFVILLDEKGKALRTPDFSSQFLNIVESSTKRLVFVVGGAYGASEKLHLRANKIWKLSDLTMNHLMAQLVCLEQLYRVCTIWKGIPYHNE